MGVAKKKPGTEKSPGRYAADYGGGWRWAATVGSGRELAQHDTGAHDQTWFKKKKIQQLNKQIKITAHIQTDMQGRTGHGQTDGWTRNPNIMPTPTFNVHPSESWAPPL